jgi:hypothetical protein
VRTPRQADALLIFNAETAPASFMLPQGEWRVLLDSSAVVPVGDGARLEGTIEIAAQTVVALLRSEPVQEAADGHA